MAFFLILPKHLTLFLMNKLSQKLTVLGWIKSLLSNRSQYATANECSRANSAATVRCVMSLY